ncbi:beta-phosphoglucomutase family hydrolase [Psychrosphaera sp. 1_MG-2023]|uniref:HAD family hydrolase n=1 Tax=Psychrosphaera sp. 1_MG-2023 TaxID=3062643 RepID=UPI0026E241D2|nr:beta-phosphoglucomutase family hydrolase [Psychrosphaera sp. 1_MG-2023]MDO6719602.1 beta-phosphoglucomutase family hydrolase [Psychrosphaera sp. 1_MG-2023]
MIDLAKFDAIIFDMDGTLVDSMGSHLEAWHKVCDKFGYDFDLDYMHGLGGVPTKQTVHILNEKFGLNHDSLVVAKYKRDVWNAMDHSPTLIASTAAVFHHYLDSKKIAVGTGAERSHAEELLAKHGLLEHLGALVTANDVTNGKPHPETFLTAAKLIGVPPEKCVVFEDTIIGKQAATAAGMACILVENGKIM